MAAKRPRHYILHDAPHARSPVFAIDGTAFQRAEADTAKPGIALCLSGGGYRAMLFHLGALWRLNEMKILREVKQVSSVSGGSITAAMLALHWDKLETFEESIVAPLRQLASHTIDVPAIVVGALLPTVTAADRIEAAYREHLYGDATLASLPEVGPDFVINASNVSFRGSPS
jgi:NTE family protein